MKRIKLDAKVLWLSIPLALSLWGINYGLPMHLIGDEESLIGASLLMLQYQQFIPSLAPEIFSLLYYPPGIPYLMILADLPILLWTLLSNGFDIQASINTLVVNLDWIWLSARILSALTGAALVAVVYKLASIIFSRPAACLASALLATSWLHVMLSHWGRHWIFTAFFAYGLILLAVLIIKNKLKKRFWLGLFAGLAIGINSLNAFAVLASVIILIFQRRNINGFRNLFIINAVIFMVIGGVLTLFNIADVARIFTGDGLQADQDQSWAGLWSHVVNIASVMWNQELIITALLVLSFIYFRRAWRTKLLILSVFITYSLFLHYIVHFENRYLYIFIPAFAMIGADTLHRLTARVKFLFYILGVLVLLYPLAIAMRYDYLLTRPDTRQQAIDYIKENFGTEHFLLSSPSIVLPRTEQSLQRASQFGRINARERHILSNYAATGALLGQSYDYQNIHFWDQTGINQEQVSLYLENRQPAYFVLDYWDLDPATHERLGEGQAEASSAWEIFLIDKTQGVHREFGSVGHTIDINGDYRGSTNVLFQMQSLGPRVIIYQF